MRDLLRVLLRIIAVTLIEAIAVFVMARLVPGIELGGTLVQQLLAALSIAIVLGLLNALIRPSIILTGLSINLYTVGLFTLIINAAILLLSGFFLPDFFIESFLAAVLGSLVLSIVNTFITGLISIDQDYAYYDGVVSWLSRQNLEPSGQKLSRGLVFLEIDGLSYERMQRALTMGLLPAVKGLLENGTHRLSHIDCGFPSQSSSCQAGIMYGDNYDIPAFRWYIKEQSRMVVSNNIADAAEINRRFFNGNGLLREGTSINNLLSGEAARSLMTISTLRDEANYEKPHSGYDLSLVFLNPYLFTRAIVLTLWDLILELFQAARQRIRNEQPRVNRLNRFFPFLRAATNVFLRDVGANAVILDVMRGSPAIYTTFMGYDEIAHRAGPDSMDALNSLKGFDRSFARILDVIERKAQIPYEVFILSDHGQSQGATFLQRTGYTLGAYLEQLVGGKSFMAEMSSAESARTQITAVLSEIQRLHGYKGDGHTRADVYSRAGRTLGKRVRAGEHNVPVDVDMLVLASGNLANVYFPEVDGKITAFQLEQRFPALLENLVAHPHIGLVVTFMEENIPWIIGKSGARNLFDGTITGISDPLLDYGDPDLRAAQIGRVAGFPHAGDLIIISTIDQDGKIAAFEELVGSHGGIGGQQTDAFLLHPADMDIPKTSNTLELYPILNGRRGDAAPVQKTNVVESKQNPWSWPVIWAGIGDVQSMFNRAARSLRLDRTLFVEVATDPYATGQSAFIVLLLALGTLIVPLISITWLDQNPPMLVSGIIVLLLGLTICLLISTLSGTARKTPHSFTRSFNALGYAGVGGFVAWFAPINTIGPLLLITGILIVLVASWLAIQEALSIPRWPAVIIPILSYSVASLVLFVVSVLLETI